MKFVRRMLALMMALAMLVSAVGFSEEAPAPEIAVEAIAEEAPEVEEVSEAPSEPEAPAEEAEESGGEAIEEVVEEPQVETAEEPGAPEGQEAEAEPAEWPGEAVPGMEEFSAEEFDAEESGEDLGFVVDDDVLMGYTGTEVDLVIPESLGITMIAAKAFKWNETLHSIVIPEGVTDIWDEAFLECTALESVSFPATLQVIGDSAFEGCVSLANIDWKDSIKQIGMRAFALCESLRSVAFPSELREIGPGAFAFSGLQSVVMRGWIDNFMFSSSESDPPLNDGLFEGCESLKQVTIEEGISGIPDEAFSGCALLEEIDLPNTVDSIGERAFMNTGLREIHLPPSLEIICEQAFSGCGALQKMTADGAVLWKIYGNAFEYCTALRDIDLPSGIETLNANVFKGVDLTQLTAHVYSGSYAKDFCDENGIHCELIDYVPLEKIELVPNPLEMKSGEWKSLAVVFTPENASDKRVEWSYDNHSQSIIDSAEEWGDHYRVYASIIASESDIATVTCTSLADRSISASCEVVIRNKPRPDPKTITLTASALTISVGQTVNLGIKSYTPADAELTKCLYISDNPEIASVAIVSMVEGQITGIKPGKTKITAMVGKAEATCTVTVTDPNKPAKINLNKTSASMAAGERFTLIATLEPASARSEITATSNKLAIVEVNPGENPGEFVVRALKKGSATIAVKTASGLSATCKVTVKKAASAVKLDKSSLQMGVGQVEQLKATVSGGAATLIWESENQGVAIVSDDGAVTATGLGETTISVRTPSYDPENPNENLIKRCTVEVLREPEELTLGASAVRLGKNEKYQLKASVNAGSYGKFVYESSDETVAKVDANGLIHASKKKTGSAIITVRTHNYDPASPNEMLEKSCSVEVVKAPGKVNISQKKATLGVGATLKLMAKTPDGTASQLTAKSGKEKVAKVAEGEAPGEFIVTAVGKGSATITIRSFNGKKATCKITVKNSPEKIELTPAEARLSVGQMAQITVKLGKNEGASYSYEVLEGAQNVKVDESGLVTAIAGGEGDVAVIQVKTHNGVTAEYTVHLLPAPQAVLVDEETLALGAKETYALGQHVNVYPGQTDFSYKSDNAKVAKVNAAGTITAVKAGTARITISTHVEGVQKVVNVEVKKAPGKVTLSEKKLTIKAGETQILTATVPEGTASHKLSVSVKNPKGKKVASAALGAEPGTVEIRAEAPGSATVTVKTYNGKQAKCQLTVEEGSAGPGDPDILPDPLPWDYLEPYDPSRDGEPEVVYANVDFYKMGMGMERELGEIEFRWTVETEDGSEEISRGVSPTSDYVRIEELTPELAVYRDGKILTQQQTGTAAFAVEAYNYDPDNPNYSLRRVFDFEVVEAPASFTMKERVEVYLREDILLEEYSEEMAEEGEIEDGSDVRDLLTFHSSNPSVVSVGIDNFLKAVGAGTATVTASLPNGGMSRSCVVTVKKRPDGYSQELTDELIYEVKNYREEMGFLYADGSLIAEEDADLNAAAKTRAQELSTKYSHKRPNGTDCLTVSGKAKAELVCKDFGDACDVADNWEEYETDVLFSEEYSKIGCGAYVKNGIVYWCLLLG